MRIVQIDRADDGFEVSWLQGIQPIKRRMFDTRAEAEEFAQKKMGARGYVISTLDMTPDQLAAMTAQRRRAREIMAQFAHG